ncbi:hypothetical protein ACFQ4J_06440 [Laceyella tengchongensis]|jgi:hypothetical protein
MNSFWGNLHISKWNQLTINERINVLQQLEQHYAKLQGREPCTIRMTDDPELMGFYEPNSYTIYVNKKLLQSDNCYEIVDTVLHEGRHAYQGVVIDKGVERESEEIVRIWEENFIGGYLNNDPDYWLQPIEFDAIQYAHNETDKIYARLAERYGENIGYEAYKLQGDRQLSKIKQDAKYDYGENYLQIIKDKVSKKNQLYMAVGQAYGFKDANKLDVRIEEFIHENYGKDTSFTRFDSLINQILAERDITREEFLAEEAERYKQKGRGRGLWYPVAQVDLADKKQRLAEGRNSSRNELSNKAETLTDKLAHTHVRLVRMMKTVHQAEQGEIRNNLKEQVKLFNRSTQAMFQKEYPDLKLKPFKLEASKVAIDIMKYNERTGQKLEPEQFRRIGLKQAEVNQVIDTQREYDQER